MNRRLLNVIVQDVNTRVNSLHLIDPWKHIFHPPSSAQAREAAAVDAEPLEKKKKKEGGAWSTDHLKLHNPRFRFESNPFVKPTPTQFWFQQPTPPPKPAPAWHSFFSALLREDSLLLADNTTDDDGAFLYDIDLNSAMAIPTMRFPKGPDCVCFSAPERHRYSLLLEERTHCFYVLDMSPPPNAIGAPSTFEVLNYSCNDMRLQPQRVPNYMNSFYWSTLPPPPPFHCGIGSSSVDTCSFMMVDDGSTSTISVSTARKGVAGTYTFDMVTHEWTRAGHWVLPFYGKAEHVPELGLSFALSADSASRRRLCALNPVAGAGPPILLHTFDHHLDQPEKWSPYKSRLLHLGLGSFCIVSFCKTARGREFALLTGVEVDRRGDGLRMIKHLSRRVSPGSHSIISCVL